MGLAATVIAFEATTWRAATLSISSKRDEGRDPSRRRKDRCNFLATVSVSRKATRVCTGWSRQGAKRQGRTFASLTAAGSTAMIAITICRQQTRQGNGLKCNEVNPARAASIPREFYRHGCRLDAAAHAAAQPGRQYLTSGGGGK